MKVRLGERNLLSSLVPNYDFFFSPTNLLQQRLGFWAQHTTEPPHSQYCKPWSFGKHACFYGKNTEVEKILPQELHSGN